MNPNYEQKYHVLNNLVGKISMQLETMKVLIENADIQIEHLAMSEEHTTPKEDNQND